jgi:hypothetical protein
VAVTALRRCTDRQLCGRTAQDGRKAMTGTGREDGATSEEVADGEVPNTETGAGIGAGAASTFEPEEDSPADEAPHDRPDGTTG